MLDEDLRDEIADGDGWSTPITLLSTVVAPAFVAGKLDLSLVPNLREALASVTRNLCGHPVTDKVLREICPSLPAPERGFWDGSTLGLAIRPKGGVRGAQAGGDTECTLVDLEAVFVRWTPMARVTASLTGKRP